MADESMSKLFLDATQVINTLDKLTKALDTYTGRLDQFVDKATNFNKSEAQMAKAAKDTADALDKQAKAASNALNALNSLQGKAAPDFAKATPAQIARVNSAIASFQSIAQKSGLTLTQLNGIVNNLGGQYTGMSAKVAAAANRYVAAVGSIGNANKGLNVTATLGSLAKVFVLQEAVAALRAVVSALGDSVEEARKFELQIAAVLTISKELQTDGLDKTAASVRRLANEFGQPIGEVAKGLYDTISNQVGDAGESFSFLTTSLVFARAALTNTANAGNLLSGVLNSYGLRAGSAQRVSDVLFKTIDVGRVTAEELANTFGRVLPLAAELGISLEEVSAQLATLTIQGLSVDESLTQISNVMLKLLKPNEELKALLKSLGYESVQAGIAAFGYQGLLQKLLDTTDGSTEATGELFNQVRALKGVIGITGEQADLYAKSLKSIRDNSIGAAKAASDLIAASPAAKFTKEFETVKNVFTDEFGRQAIKSIVLLVDNLGGAENAAKQLATGLNALMTTLVALGTVPTVAIGNFINGLDALSGSLKDRTREANDLVAAIASSRDGAIKNEIAANASTVANRKASVALSVSIIEQQFAEFQKLYNKDEQAAIAQQKKISASYKDQLNDRLNAVQALSNKLQEVQNEALKNQKSASQKTLDLDFRINQGKFDNSLDGKSDPQKAAALIARSEKLLAASKEALRKGNEDFSGKLFDEAVSAAEKAAGITGQRAKGEAQLNRLLEQQKQHERDIISLEKEKASIAEQEQQRILQKENELRNLIADFNAIQDEITDSKGKVTEDQLSKLSKDAAKVGSQIEKTLGSISINKLIDFDISRINRPFLNASTGQPVKLNIAIEDSIKDLETQLKKTLLTIPAQLILDTKKLTGQDISKLGGFRGAESSLAAFKEELNKSIENTTNELVRLKGETSEAIKPITTQAITASKALDDLRISVRNLSVSGAVTQKGNAQLDALKEQIASVQRQAKLSINSGDLGGAQRAQKDLQRVTDTLNKPTSVLSKLDLSKVKISVAQLNAELSEARKDMTELARVMIQAEQDLSNQKLLEGVRNQVDDVSGASKILNRDFIELGSSAQIGATGAAAALQGLDTVIEAQAAKLSALLEQYKALNSLGSGGGGGPVQTKAKGGPVSYFAEGGPVGTDTIAAYLSPKEYVMDSRNASKYATELRSMSRGEFPTGSDFGISNNTTIGDININMNGNPSKESAREMADEMRRQVRLRTMRSF
jgi:TP901 family phage tail tape measure protein